LLDDVHDCQGEKVQTIGPHELEHCPECEQEREFVPQLKYSYGQFDLLFGFIYNRRYQLACSDANHGWILHAHTARQTYGKPSIPFHLQYGFVVLIGLAATVAAAAYLYRHAA
jgi:hypothetical protein